MTPKIAHTDIYSCSAHLRISVFPSSGPSQFLQDVSAAVAAPLDAHHDEQLRMERGLRKHVGKLGQLPSVAWCWQLVTSHRAPGFCRTLPGFRVWARTDSGTQAYCKEERGGGAGFIDSLPRPPEFAAVFILGVCSHVAWRFSGYYTPRFIATERCTLCPSPSPPSSLPPLFCPSIFYMSCALVLSPSTDSLSFVPRKRTMSFSTPTPCKAARTPLRRTGSYLSLADMQAADFAPLYGRDGPTKTYTGVDSLVMGHYDARMRKRRTPPCRAPAVHATPASSQSHSSPSPNLHLSSSRRIPSRPRRSSPLAPMQHPMPERPSLPCTKKREPDLYRTAIETRMRLSPVGRNILNMGPRIAMSIFTATEALESLVAAQRDWDMPDVAMEASWVDVLQDDWEMVERDT